MRRRRNEATHDWLPALIDLLRTRTTHNFTLYKPGTLRRRIERRMAMASIEPTRMDRYLDLLRRDAGALNLLAEDLLINVTSFFRDPKVFDLLAAKIIPDLIAGRSSEHPVRVWVAGCSTGEEAYSLAMLFREAVTDAKSSARVQIFASDVDPDAVASAREGVYPATIEADVSPARLARFFSKEDRGYRVQPDLRAMVVFTVQDILTDPPFARLDLISCRNMLIYLGLEAQANIVACFISRCLMAASCCWVARRRSATPTAASRSSRRRSGSIAMSGIADRARSASCGASVMRRARRATGQGQMPSRQAALAELCRRRVMEAYAPAAVLINPRHECLFSMGPTDRFLRVAPGHPTHDLLAMARPDLRIKLRSAIQQANQRNARVVVAGGRGMHDGASISFSIDVQPVQNQGEDLLLICFVDEPTTGPAQRGPMSPVEVPRVAALEQELDATRTELQSAIHNLEVSNEEQKAIHEEALSVNEEFQSTNEELLTSKEELQSLNEELTALNSQLQETLDRQRTTSNDLQNVLYSTDVATIFLDSRLRIRFFTPATKSLFSVIPSDIGRPLADLSSLAADSALLTDATTVMRTLAPIEREIEAQDGAWYTRRVLPYRTPENNGAGVVITFADVTERHHVADELEVAKRQAEHANVAKSRFLAAASHDLRQPLQTLALLQGLLAKNVESEKAHNLVRRVDETLGAITGMLNTLLDINQIESGTVQAVKTDFPVGTLLSRLKDEFTYHAQAKQISLRVVSSGLSIHSDQRMLEQILRNLLSNALKYTKRGKVLLGCRRRGELLAIEVWDTGIGIPEAELRAIFEEYHQVANPARERSHGLGLGLSIVQRLSDLLGHQVHVRSRPGKGSVFAIDVMLASDTVAPERATDRPPAPMRSMPPCAGTSRSWSSRTIPRSANCLNFSSGKTATV